MTKKRLALDIGTTMGWCYADDDNDRLAAGAWELPQPPPRSKDGGPRLGKLWFNMSEMHRMWGIEEVIVEQHGHLQGHANRVLPLLTGVAELWAYLNDASFVRYSPSEIKKYATGNGRASKDRMLTAAGRKWRELNIETHDVADALWIMEYRRSKV